VSGTKPVAGRVPIEAANDLYSTDDSAAAESALDLERLLQQLPDAARVSIRDVKLRGFSVAETAQRRGLSESMVKVSIHRGLKRLAKLLGAEKLK